MVFTFISLLLAAILALVLLLAQNASRRPAPEPPHFLERGRGGGAGERGAYCVRARCGHSAGGLGAPGRRDRRGPCLCGAPSAVALGNRARHTVGAQ